VENYLYHYIGNLEFYHETGMECLAPILHDNRGITKAPSFNNGTKKWDGPEMEYKSLSWSVWFNGGEYLKVYNEDNSVLWEGPLTKDRFKMIEKKYNYAFLPKEISFEVWYSWFCKELKAEVFTNKPVTAEKNKEKE